MKKRILSTTLAAAALVALYTSNVSAGVLFEDSFDAQSDWWPTQAVTSCGDDSCVASVPSGWNYFYNEELWNPYDSSNPIPTSHPTIQVSGENHTGTSGKAFTVWNESNLGKSGDGWGANGVLAKDLGQDYNELYVQAKIKFQPGFQWKYTVNGNAGMAKILRFYHWDRNGSPFTYFSSGYSGPMNILDLENGYWGFDSLVSFRCAPQSSNYYCSPISQAHGPLPSTSFTQTLGDGNWHTLTLYGKMNSAPGVADGVSRVFVDGNVIYENTTLKWLESNGAPGLGWNVVAIGGNAYNTYSDPVNRAEQWYALDDVVVSTAPIPATYVIGSSSGTDTIAPTAVISSPVANSTQIGIMSVVAAASDNVGVSKVELYMDGSLTGTQFESPYTFAIDTTMLPNGPHTLKAKAYDAANNVGESGNVAFNVNNAVADTTAPAVSLTSPAKNSVVSATTIISASASDNVGVTRVDFYINGSLRASVNNSPYSFNWNITAETNGQYILTAKGYDAAGNVGTSGSVTVSVVNDSVAPAVNSFTMPATAATPTVPVSISATDNVAVAGYLISEISATPLVTDARWTSNAPTSFTFADNGTRTAYAWAKDAAGNVSAASAATVTIDNIAPVISAPSLSINGPSLTISASATDNFAVTKMQVYVDNALQLESYSNYISCLDKVGKGSHTVTVMAYDAAGNMSTRSANIIR